MRKNGIDRELRALNGGVCAVEGYSANAVSCGLSEEGGLDFALLLSERRCSVGCVYATGKNVGASVKVSKRNIRLDYARAMLINGGAANLFDEEGERLALAACDLLFPYGVERTETLIASTGEMGKKLRFSAMQSGIKPLWAGLSASEEGGSRFSKALGGGQLAFSFYLGDYACKIGGTFTRGANDARIVLLTTDVNITSSMLQKAISAEVRETLALLQIGLSTPNDVVCIFANGKAGNYRIDCVDSEYKKFALALRAVLTEICKAIARHGEGIPFVCRVFNGKSKELVRSVACAVASNEEVKASFVKGEGNINALLCAILSVDYEVETKGLRISLYSKAGEVLLFDGERLPIQKSRMQDMLTVGGAELRVYFQGGNFQATAFGKLP